jgi:hypothetical protein
MTSSEAHAGRKGKYVDKMQEFVDKMQEFVDKT